MSYSVIISNKKITGLEQSAVTQPKDAVPLSMFQDLSAYVYTLSNEAVDISNLQIEINDLSAVVYDLSGYVYSLSNDSISVGSYDNNGGTIIYNNINTLLFDASNFILDDNNGSTTLKIAIDSSNSGGGGIVVSDLSYLFFDKPILSTNGTGINVGSTQINLSWTPPPQTQSALNFVNPSLGTTSSGINSYNALPFINDLWVGHRLSSTPNTGIGSYTKKQYSTIGGASNYAPIYVNKIEAQNTGSNIAPLYTLNQSGTNDVTMGIDFGTPASTGAEYSFCIGYANNNEDGVSNTPNNWNYIFIPDNSSSYIPFGQPGPANPPSKISFSGITSLPQSLKVEGLGAPNPPGQGTGMDSSLNIPYNTSSSLSIGYGVNIEVRNSTSSIQASNYTLSSTIFDASAGYPTTSYNLRPWEDDINDYIHPENIFSTRVDVSNTYYAINSSTDYSNNKVPAALDISSAYGLKIPERSEVSTVYDKFLNPGNFSLNPTVTYAGGGVSVPIPARNRNVVSYPLINNPNIHFISDTSNLRFIEPDTWKLATNYGTPKTEAELITEVENNVFDLSFVPIDANLGITCSGENTCFIQQEVVSTNTSPNNPYIGPFSSTPRKGFYNNDSATGIESSTPVPYLNISSSASIPLQNPSHIPVTEGFYLGFDVSLISLIDISLGILPDICNNSFNPYEWKISQHLNKNNSITPDILAPVKYSFSIAETPSKNTKITGFTTTPQNPGLVGTEKFYGLPLPTNQNMDLEFDYSFTIDDLFLNYAPTTAIDIDGLYDISLTYNPSGQSPLTLATNISVEENKSTWIPTLNNTSYPVNGTLKVDYDGTSNSSYDDFKYSRDISNSEYGAGDQFQISLVISNNITYETSLKSTEVVSQDLSSNGLPWWWDFTWGMDYTITSPPPSGTSGTVINKPNSMNVSLCEIINPFTVTYASSIPGQYDQTIDISLSVAMWAKDGWFGDICGNHPFKVKEYPYINYSGNFHGLTGKDYSLYSGQGITQTINYYNNYSAISANTTATVSYPYYNLKWVIFKITDNTTSTTLNWDATVEEGTTVTNGNAPWTSGKYIVFYLEKADSGTPYSVNGFLSNQSYTPWLDCQNVNVNSTNIYNFSDGQNFTAGGTIAQPGTNNGCQPSGTSSGGGVREINRFAIGPITRYVAFGIRQGIKLKSVTFS